MPFEDQLAEVEVVGNKVIVRGEIDISTAPMLEDGLAECVRAGWQQPIVDLSAVTYFDSSGIQVLLKAKAAMADGQGPICIIGLSEHASRVFRLVGLDRFFKVVPPAQQFS